MIAVQWLTADWHVVFSSPEIIQQVLLPVYVPRLYPVHILLPAHDTEAIHAGVGFGPATKTSHGMKFKDSFSCYKHNETT